MTDSTCAVCFIALIVYLFKRAFHQRNVLKSLTQQLGNKKLHSGEWYNSEFDGIGYQYSYFGGGETEPSHFIINLGCPSNGEFKVAKEKGIDKLFKKYGLAVEVQTNDSTFDSQVYLRSNTELFTKQFFSDARKRSAVLQLLKMGFTSLSLANGELELAKFYVHQFKEVTDDFVTKVLRNLIILARDHPQVLSSD